jgi:retinol dehydrogenase-12
MSTFSQVFPPTPTFTEKNLPDLSGKVHPPIPPQTSQSPHNPLTNPQVYIITGSTSGVGLALAKMLHARNATLYLGARSSTRFSTAVTALQASAPHSTGLLKPFIADLSDLSTIKPAVDLFLSETQRLDVLFLNAAVMTPPPGSKSVQGHDLEMGTNCLSSFLLVSLLQPMLQATARLASETTSVRVVWVSSLIARGLSSTTPKGGVQFDASGAPKQLKDMANYMQSKAGAVLLAHEFSLRQKATPTTTSTTTPTTVLHIALHPGFLKTELQRYMPAPLRALTSATFKGAEFGAYTELYAGLSPEVRDGDWVIPWGRRSEVPGHVEESFREGGGESVSKCGSGNGNGNRSGSGSGSVSARFWEWCEGEVKDFA